MAKARIVSIPLFLLLFCVNGLVVLDRKRLPGIWKLLIASENFPSRSQQAGRRPTMTSSEDPFCNTTTTTSSGASLEFWQQQLSQSKNIQDDEEGILLKLNPDGSFRQCNEGYQEGQWISGRWKLHLDRRKLLLAIDRQYYGSPNDTLLEGTINNEEEEQGVMKVEGDVLTGRCMYPKQHPMFFEQPLSCPFVIGNFSMDQAVSTYAFLPKDDRRKSDPVVPLENKPSDFYSRRFIMTIEPIDGDGGMNNNNHHHLQQPVDIRVMPIEFFRNDTFRALGTNKILRGRFGITNNDDLWFQVSTFGAGRSMPGSIYSEGIGLTHEDKRSYVGEIQTNAGRIFVSGSVTFGSDLGSDARPEPVGTFLLTEVVDDHRPRDIPSSDRPFQ